MYILNCEIIPYSDYKELIEKSEELEKVKEELARLKEERETMINGYMSCFESAIVKERDELYPKVWVEGKRIEKIREVCFHSEVGELPELYIKK